MILHIDDSLVMQSVGLLLKTYVGLRVLIKFALDCPVGWGQQFEQTQMSLQLDRLNICRKYDHNFGLGMISNMKKSSQT